MISGRYFKSDIEKLKRAANDLSRRMLDEGYISLNDFYYEIALPETKLGDELAWYFTKKKYEEILQDDKVVLTSKEDFSEKQETKIAEVGIKTKPDLAEYSSMLRRYNRVDYSDVGK